MPKLGLSLAKSFKSSAGEVPLVPGAGTVNFAMTSYQVDEGAGSAFVALLRSGGNTGSVSVTLRLADNTAVAPGDYDDTAIVVTFPERSNAASAAIPIVADSVFEANETVDLTIDTPTGGVSIGATNTATLTIVNDDAAPQFTVDDPSTTEGDSGSKNLVFTVSVVTNTSYQSAIGISYATEDITATAGVDYTAQSGSLTFNPGGPFSQVVNVPILGDENIETNEQIGLRLSSPTGGATILKELGTGTIIEDDVPIPGEFQFSSTTYNVNEDAGPATLQVNRVNGSDGAVSVQVIDTGAGTAVSPTDYTSDSYTLSFADGETSKTFDVVIGSDLVEELDETVVYQLTNATGGASIGSPSTATLTIVNDDEAGVFVLDSATYSVSEATGSVDITVNRTTGQDGAVTVDFATVGTTATAGSDFTDASQTLSFANGEASKVITITVADDAFFEADEEVNISLSNPTGGAELGSPSTAVLTLTSADLQPTLSIDSPSAVLEPDVGTTTITFTVTLSGNTNLETNVTVDFATADGTASAPGDYVASSGTLIFTDGGATTQTIDITINSDAVVEVDENFTVTLSNATGGATIGTAVGTGTISVPGNNMPGSPLLWGTKELIPGQGTGAITGRDSNNFVEQALDVDANGIIPSVLEAFRSAQSADQVFLAAINEQQSGTRNFTQASTGDQPVILNNVLPFSNQVLDLNTIQAAYFEEGSGHDMTLSGGFDAASGNFTFWFYGTMTEVGSTNSGLFASSGASNFDCLQSGTDLLLRVAGDTVTIKTGLAYPEDIFLLVEVRSDGWGYYFNGTTVTSGGSADATDTRNASFTLYNRRALNQGASGTFGACGCYIGESRLTDAKEIEARARATDTTLRILPRLGEARVAGNNVYVDVFLEGDTTALVGSQTAVTVNYATSDDTAVAGTNYTSTSGTLSLGWDNPYVGRIEIPTTAVGTVHDTIRFTLSLSSASQGVTIQQSTISVYILDNKAASASPSALLLNNFSGASPEFAFALNRLDQNYTSGLFECQTSNGRAFEAASRSQDGNLDEDQIRALAGTRGQSEVRISILRNQVSGNDDFTLSASFWMLLMTNGVIPRGNGTPDNPVALFDNEGPLDAGYSPTNTTDSDYSFFYSVDTFVGRTAPGTVNATHYDHRRSGIGERGTINSDGGNFRARLNGGTGNQAQTAEVQGINTFSHHTDATGRIARVNGVEATDSTSDRSTAGAPFIIETSGAGLWQELWWVSFVMFRSNQYSSVTTIESQLIGGNYG